VTKKLIAVQLLLLPLSAQDPKPADDRNAMRMVVVIGEPLSVQVTEVGSLSGSERVGFGRGPTLYHVYASGPSADYSVYCVKAAPLAGTAYMAHIDYLDGIQFRCCQSSTSASSDWNRENALRFEVV